MIILQIHCFQRPYRYFFPFKRTTLKARRCPRNKKILKTNFWKKKFVLFFSLRHPPANHEFLQKFQPIRSSRLAGYSLQIYEWRPWKKIKFWTKKYEILKFSRLSETYIRMSCFIIRIITYDKNINLELSLCNKFSNPYFCNLIV